ncbi:MAG: peptide-methionine (S)-S-oxide reductase [Azospirillum brasilense]|nr:MAG: peptide-methionine (S)-S-oxide reductase [Azospirillum brasilense]
MAADAPKTTDTAIFAGGCFWCMQPVFDNTPGVIRTSVGYSGGDVANPTYEQVSTDTTGHYEVIEVTYDPAKVSYETLLDVYWHDIDPLDAGGQMYDRGTHYQTVIFVNSEAQRSAAEASKKKVEAFFAPRPVATQILPAKPFYAAEDYHQKYYEKSKIRYNAYKYGSGREEKLKKLWQENLREPMPAE